MNYETRQIYTKVVKVNRLVGDTCLKPLSKLPYNHVGNCHPQMRHEGFTCITTLNRRSDGALIVFLDDGIRWVHDAKKATVKADPFGDWS